MHNFQSKIKQRLRPAKGETDVPSSAEALAIQEAGDVEQSTGATVPRRREDNSEHVVKEDLAHLAANRNLGAAKEALGGVGRMNDKCLRVLKTFKTLVDTLHPIAQVGVGLLTKAAQMILDQDTLDGSVSALLEKVQEVYEFLLERDMLEYINTKEHILVQIAQVVGNCAEFIAKYSERKSFDMPYLLSDTTAFLLETTSAVRLGKQFFLDTKSDVDDLNKRLDALMQRYRDRAVQSIHINVSRLSEDFKIDGMAYAKDVGLMTEKKCLDGTRGEVLATIIRWINDPDPNVPRIFYLHGQAGKGKSAIAHTIALWCKSAGILGSCFCFARDRQTEHLERRIFTTISHDLANRDPLFRRAVTDAIAADDSVKTTPDAIQQWEKLIVPAFEVSAALVGKVVIVIDALDQAGAEASRRVILPLLAERVSSLPPTFRILVASRPLPDVQKLLKNLPFSRDMSLDGVPTEYDIRLYVTTELANQDEIGETEVQQLARKSDGLFEWARLACEYIRTSAAGQTGKERFNDVMSRGSEEGNLLDTMYHAILQSAIGKKPLALKRFRSVMQQVLSSFEPLPMDTLDAMRTMFPDKNDCCYKVNLILGFMGSLFSGVVDPSMP
ncbi:hypothetical protein ID866_10761, partial [Astraeus odoratus]